MEEEMRKKEEERIEALENMEVKTGSYQVQVHIIEVRDLKPEDPNGTSDPVVHIEIGGQKQHTEVKQKQTSCVFDDQFFFDFNDMDRNKMEELSLSVKVYDADMISRNDLIGHWGIDMTEVYFLPGHELYRQWVGVADEKGDVVKINGYLKLSVTFLHSTEKPVKHDIETELEKEEGEEKEGISSMVMMPPHIHTELQFLVLTVSIYFLVGVSLKPLKHSHTQNNTSQNRYTAQNIFL